jgi:hypothetical protein
VTTVRERGALSILASFMALFLGAGVLGLTLAETFAPESFLATFVSLFALPLAFGVGLQMWFGTALIGAIIRFVGSRGRPAPASRTDVETVVAIPGSIVFLPISSVAGATAGIVVGLLSSTVSGWLVWLVYWAVGTIHGLASWRLARAGYLRPPDSI